MLTEAMRREIVNYMLDSWSKGLIEDDRANPETAGAFERNEISGGEIEEYIRQCRDALLENLPVLGDDKIEDETPESEARQVAADFSCPEDEEDDVNSSPPTYGHASDCIAVIGRVQNDGTLTYAEWKSHPNPDNPDNEWICEECGGVIPGVVPAR